MQGATLLLVIRSLLSITDLQPVLVTIWNHRVPSSLVVPLLAGFVGELAVVGLFLIALVVLARYLREFGDVAGTAAYEDRQPPEVGATADIVQRVTPVAGLASFDAGFGSEDLPVRTESGSIDIGETVVVVDHSSGVPIVEEQTPTVVTSPTLSSGTEADPTEDSGSVADSESDAPSTAESGTDSASPADADSSTGSGSGPDSGSRDPDFHLPELGVSHTYELAARDGTRYALEVAPVLKRTRNPPAHHDGSVLAELSSYVEFLADSGQSLAELDPTTSRRDRSVMNHGLWIETVEVIEQESPPESESESTSGSGRDAGSGLVTESEE